MTTACAAGRLGRLTSGTRQAARHLGLGSRLLAPESLPLPRPVPLTHTSCRLGLQSQPPDQNGQGSEKARYRVTHAPKVWMTGRAVPSPGDPQVSCLSFVNGATKSLSYLVNPKLRKKETVVEREAKGSQNKQVCPWISGFLRGFRN